MSAEIVFRDAIVFIATVAAILRFAFVEYESVLAAWRRMVAAHRGR